MEEILKAIPQRDPFLFVDTIIDQDKETISCSKTITGDEDFFKGHFPGKPIMPGVLIIEALAQASAVLVVKTLKAKPNSKGVLFASITTIFSFIKRSFSRAL